MSAYYESPAMSHHNRHHKSSPSDVKETNGQDDKQSRPESISSEGTSIESSRSSSFDEAREHRRTHKTTSSIPTPIKTSHSSRFRPPPLSPRSFRSSRSPRSGVLAPLTSDGMPKPRSPQSSLYSRRHESKRSPSLHSAQSPSTTQSPPFSPRSLKSIFSSSHIHSPSAGSHYSTSTSTTIASTAASCHRRDSASQIDPTTAAATLPPGQTIAPKLFDRNIPRSKQNREPDAPPLPTPSFFEPHDNPLDTAPFPPASSTTHTGGKESSNPLSKLASRFKAVLGGGSSSGGASSAEQKAMARRKKSSDRKFKPKTARLVTEKVEDVHWTEM
ncbi:hypothetical protein EJ05DRAFT_476031 [Pseudovirgaria hyperparasitica]|uniref:Uncharacterized protein n=1 Tax=Pseudovirgaria hyperparasitica TaxID=470096 RepID=A0A6A6W758_9PEZI|nr:uncharacterized protein EJ05DRAFT_476031 [Pseudovirgaria hyperparasitica]KAF2758718.1 hypothetical protein EJ05DRAFT_476031 [Pseudovirgaria hyperparasitica]